MKDTNITRLLDAPLPSALLNADLYTLFEMAMSLHSSVIISRGADKDIFLAQSGYYIRVLTRIAELLEIKPDYEQLAFIFEAAKTVSEGTGLNLTNDCVKLSSMSYLADIADTISIYLEDGKVDNDGNAILVLCSAILITGVDCYGLTSEEIVNRYAGEPNGN